MSATLVQGAGIIYSIEFSGSPNVPTNTPVSLEIRATFSQPLVAAAFRLSVSGTAGATLIARDANPLAPNGLSFISTTQQTPYAGNLPVDIKATPSMEVLLDLDHAPPSADGLAPGSNILIERVTLLPSGTGLLTVSLSEASGATTQGGADGTLLEPVNYGRPSITLNVVAAPICHHPRFDADGDGNVDQSDFGVIQACFTGPDDAGHLFNPNPCSCFDVDHDLDIDLGDLAAFELCSSGPGLPAVPTCGD